jgi:hypothetical protein
MGLVAMVAYVIGEYFQPPRPVVLLIIIATWVTMFLIWRSGKPSNQETQMKPVRRKHGDRRNVF